MKVLLVHNRYRQRAGEDGVFDADWALLMGRVNLTRFVVDNRELSPTRMLETAWRLIFGSHPHRALTRLLRNTHPNVVSFYNSFPQISPWAYQACRNSGAAVIQRLDNFRIWCAPGTFFRNGRPCEDCAPDRPWNAVRHACFRGSRIQSAIVARMQARTHRAAVWTRDIDLYIALTEWSRSKAIALGLPQDRVAVKPNYVEDPGTVRGEPGNYALFVGRLSVEKGLETALRALAGLPDRMLLVAGDGPDRARLESIAPPNVRFLGWLPRPEILRLMLGASFLIFPSLWYEAFGLVILEAMAAGLPVIATRMGGIPDIVREGETGMLFEAGNQDDLAAKARHLFENREMNSRMGVHARSEYLSRYTPARNRELILSLYQRALELRMDRSTRPRSSSVP